MAIELETSPTTTASSKGSSSLRLGGLSLSAHKVSAKDRMFFTERLALLLETGTDLHAALGLLEGQIANPAFGEVIAALRADVAAGASLAHALAKHPQVFNATYVNLVGASEHGGFLAEVLKQLMAMEEKSAELRATLVSAFSYPGFLVVFSLGVVVFVLSAVFPKFKDLFSAIQDQLPASTVVLMATSDLLRQYWMLLLGVCSVGAFLLVRWLRQPAGAAVLDRLKLTLPLIRDIFSQLYFAQITRVLGLSLANGVPALEALRACQEVVRNRRFRQFMGNVETSVVEGKGMAAGFRQSGLVPPLVKQMVATGEDTGNLPLVMERIAVFYERELTRRLNTLSKLIEPAMLVIMGVVVGIIVSSLILPIFKLSRAVH